VPLRRSLAPLKLAICYIARLLPFWWVGEVGFSLVGSVKSALRYIVHLPPFWWGEGLDFRVKGGLVIELLFRVCLKNGLGSFVGWSTFILSPSPLGST
jgi:hypothetical protein